MTTKELYNVIMSDQFEIGTDGFRLIDELKREYCKHPTDKLGACVHAYLLRLRREFPCVYAITIGQFPNFEPFIDQAKDPEGYQVLLPKAFGPYADWLYDRQMSNEDREAYPF